MVGVCGGVNSVTNAIYTVVGSKMPCRVRHIQRLNRKRFRVGEGGLVVVFAALLQIDVKCLCFKEGWLNNRVSDALGGLDTFARIKKSMYVTCITACTTVVHHDTKITPRLLFRLCPTCSSSA